MSPLRRIQRTAVSIYCHPNSQQSAVPTSLGSGPGAKSALAMHSQCCQHPAGLPAAFQDTCRIPLHWFRQTRCGPHVSGMDWPTKGMSWSLNHCLLCLVVPCCGLCQVECRRMLGVEVAALDDTTLRVSCLSRCHRLPQFLQQTLPTLPSLLFWPNILQTWYTRAHGCRSLGRGCRGNIWHQCWPRPISANGSERIRLTLEWPGRFWWSCHQCVTPSSKVIANLEPFVEWLQNAQGGIQSRETHKVNTNICSPIWPGAFSPTPVICIPGASGSLALRLNLNLSTNGELYTLQWHTYDMVSHLVCVCVSVCVCNVMQCNAIQCNLI